MLADKEVQHLVGLVKQKFISPYKIIYLVDQKEADHFKTRNQSVGCCTASEVTIPVQCQTRLERELAGLITGPAVKGYLPELLAYCEDRYSSIVEKGKSDKLQITQEVQKYLVDNIMAEAVNKFIHGKLVSKLAQESRSLSTEIGLWATPATWHSKYPTIQLDMFQSTHLAQLFQQGHTVVQGKFDNFLTQASQELLLLEKDGRFEEILWKDQSKPDGNESKILRNPMQYASMEKENKFRNLATICVLLQSIPFELNMKANSYLTISDSIQAFHYSQAPLQASRKISSFKYEVLLPVNIGLCLSINGRELTIKKGSIFISANLHEFQFKCDNPDTKDAFILRSYISQAKRNK